MQHRSGTNPHEPVLEDKRSRVWKFILRDISEPRVPESFIPHVNLCAWFSKPQDSNAYYYTVRGIIQTTNPRNYYTLKTRYSKRAEWIPVLPSDLRQINEFLTGPVPRLARRFVHRNANPTPLHKVGYNIEVPDLVSEYEDAIYADIIANAPQELPPDEEEDDDQFPMLGEDAESSDDDTQPTLGRTTRTNLPDSIQRNPYTGEVISGVINGYQFEVRYDPRTRTRTTVYL